jgi:hypothetical protein
MKSLRIVLALSLIYVLCGCSGTGAKSFRPPVGPPAGPPSGTPPEALNITGNWQFTATPTDPGTLPVTIAGSINQSNSALDGLMHVQDSNCFDQLNIVSLTGALTDGNVLLASTSVDGQVITLAGSVSTKTGFPNTFTGTYEISGGCANNEHGNVTGYSVDGIIGVWYGNLTTSGGVDIHWGTDKLGQVGVSSEGSFGLTGNFSFDGACFTAGALTPGTFPTPSFIMGTSVALDIPTGNGTISFIGKADQGGLIRGSYTVSGGSCESAGTGYLSPWEY